MNSENEKRTKKLKEKIQVANRLKMISDDLGGQTFDNYWLLKNIIGLTEEEIKQMERTNLD